MFGCDSLPIAFASKFKCSFAICFIATFPCGEFAKKTDPNAPCPILPSIEYINLWFCVMFSGIL